MSETKGNKQLLCPNCKTLIARWSEPASMWCFVSRLASGTHVTCSKCGTRCAIPGAPKSGTLREPLVTSVGSKKGN